MYQHAEVVHWMYNKEIERRAVLIRDHNNKRIAIKNQIAEIFNCPVREINTII